MSRKYKKDLYSLLHEASISMGRGPRQGLSVRPGQNKVLKILNKQEDGTLLQQELLKMLGIRAASLSELLRKLEDEGYVSRARSKRGGTELLVTITEKGRISAIECELSEKERDAELFGCLNPDEREELVRVLNKLLDVWYEAEGETEGSRKERRWRENAKAQDEQREINALLANIAEAK